jgi:glycerophosphoryl diester phosphodiesterase
MESDSMTVNYAHRGASGYCPENTMIAFEKAINLGCTGIETDVQMTSDGVLVLIHDEMVNRTTEGAGFVKDYTYNEIRKLNAGSWFSSEYSGIKIPSVEELILFSLNKSIVLNFEIKSEIINYKGIEEKLIELIYKYNIQDRVIISSFNHYSTVKCKEISKDIKTGILYYENLYKPEGYAKSVLAEALHPYFYVLNKEVMERARIQGLMVNTYTVNDVNYMRYFVQHKIDGIITNYPDKLKKIIEEHSG